MSPLEKHSKSANTMIFEWVWIAALVIFLPPVGLYLLLYLAYESGTPPSLQLENSPGTPTREAQESDPYKDCARGLIKWFSNEKGYGYITDTLSGVDHYFRVPDIKGGIIPKNGSSVAFVPVPGKKGPRASQIQVTSLAQYAPHKETQNNRESCKSCGKNMIPRLVTYKGVPSRSYCPFCGSLHKNFDTSLDLLELMIKAIIFMVQAPFALTLFIIKALITIPAKGMIRLPKYVQVHYQELKQAIHEKKQSSTKL